MSCPCVLCCPVECVTNQPLTNHCQSALLTLFFRLVSQQPSVEMLIVCSSFYNMAANRSLPWLVSYSSSFFVFFLLVCDCAGSAVKHSLPLFREQRTICNISSVSFFPFFGIKNFENAFKNHFDLKISFD